jgi:hypothetical protein
MRVILILATLVASHAWFANAQMFADEDILVRSQIHCSITLYVDPNQYIGCDQCLKQAKGPMGMMSKKATK